mmetsp:Transcript_136539/g.340482  ORF Transcript_136539/g.340482 Transcript_136539/m.340482 type:complete len:215 (+) Transcript_136539:1876-2520(+)
MPSKSQTIRMDAAGILLRGAVWHLDVPIPATVAQLGRVSARSRSKAPDRLVLPPIDVRHTLAVLEDVRVSLDRAVHVEAGKSIDVVIQLLPCHHDCETSWNGLRVGECHFCSGRRTITTIPTASLSVALLVALTISQQERLATTAKVCTRSWRCSSGRPCHCAGFDLQLRSRRQGGACWRCGASLPRSMTPAISVAGAGTTQLCCDCTRRSGSG